MPSTQNFFFLSFSMLDNVLVKVDFYSKIVIYIYLCILSISTYTHTQNITTHNFSFRKKMKGGREEKEEDSSGLLAIECTYPKVIDSSLIYSLLLCCYRIWDQKNKKMRSSGHLVNVTCTKPGVEFELENLFNKDCRVFA